jgi:hypothetical protein
LLETWEAQRLEHILSSGRTRPLVVECSRADTLVTHEDIQASSELRETGLFVVKGFDLPEITNFGLFSEVFGNQLARSLGIDTPAPSLVHLSIPFVEATNLVLRRENLALRASIASGCEYFRKGFSNVSARSLSSDELEQAIRIYGFDLLVQNPDRTVSRPNCAALGAQIKLFDFETAFSFVRLIGTQHRPWEVSKHGLGPKHLFYSELARKKRELNWKPFIKSVAGITGNAIDEMIERLPQDWLEHAPRVRAHLLEVAKNVHRLELELQRSLV